MDIEDLNKSQIILLTLLVSFVTSIATGIVTVSLMEKAPKDVVRVVQRVVERTVEKVDSVAPVAGNKEVIIQEKTVIVDESDKLAKAISVNKNKIVKIYEKDTDKFVAFGIPIKYDILLTDAGAIDTEKEYIISISPDEFRDVSVLKVSGARAVAKLQLDSDYKLKTVNLNSDKDIKLGTKVFIFNGSELNSIATGVVSKITPSSFATNIDAEEMLPGTPVFDYAGNVVGMSTASSREDSITSFVKGVSLEAVDTDTLSSDNASDTEVAESANSATTTETSQSANAQGTVNP